MISYYRYGYFCSSSTAYYLYIITHILKLGHTTSKAAHMQPISLFSLLLPSLSPSAIPLSSLFFSLRAQFKWITISSHPHPSQQKYIIDRYISQVYETKIAGIVICLSEVHEHSNLTTTMPKIPNSRFASAFSKRKKQQDNPVAGSSKPQISSCTSYVKKKPFVENKETINQIILIQREENYCP